MYEYWEVLVRVCKTDEELKKFKYRYDTVYVPLCLEGFNDCDLYAREAMEEFYVDGTGWDNEQLVETDISPITWRKLASRWNRGIAAGQGRSQRHQDFEHSHASSGRRQGAQLLRREDRKC
jgi:hypothetical protein